MGRAATDLLDNADDVGTSGRKGLLGSYEQTLRSRVTDSTFLLYQTVKMPQNAFLEAVCFSIPCLPSLVRILRETLKVSIGKNMSFHDSFESNWKIEYISYPIPTDVCPGRTSIIWPNQHGCGRCGRAALPPRGGSLRPLLCSDGECRISRS